MKNDYDINLPDFLTKLLRHIENNGAEIVSCLKRAAQPDFEFPETITPEEERYIKAIIKWLLEVGPTNQRTVARMAVLLMSYIYYDEFHYPQPETGVYDIAGSEFEKLKWVYRYWFNQLEVAEKGSGIEQVFASQDLSELAKDPPENTENFSFSCAGDLLAVDVLTPENTNHLFDEIRDFYSTADIVSANLESTVHPKQPIGRTQSPGKPAQMNTSIEMLNRFNTRAGINFVSTATNHAMDWDADGVKETINSIQAFGSGMKFSGTVRDPEHKESPLYLVSSGAGRTIKVAVLCFTMDLNGYGAPPKDSLVNEVRFNDVKPRPDYSLIERQIAAARRDRADWIIAYVHWGWEFEMYPHVNIREAAREIIARGVDTILGNHAHVSQPAELIPRPDNKQDALVIYSFGDFVSYHPESRNSKLSYIVKFNVTTTRQDSYISALKVLPIYIVNEDLHNGKFNCRIVKFQNVLDNPDAYGLTDIEKSQLPHLRDKVWNEILSPLSKLSPIN
ncbi:poly-gamma-glutamate synthesis protein (capsule biosynthesis protein) [Pseudomonas nitritireducens]|uniref:Poly-gamma-glutamate synthesis protein (Capsule biosynthesis protein) n=1 Tax=Pseudomonas nitroreducens TaxID=46680 RepID=A0A7W7KNX2_PSENT|nr:CapA family protein [Pseudomonas nitritireducens]MBB4866267.1 poly-gamma-glutamate synthesis protein (capsule biosynthesis protein) [Pseudomonas nitritireducens]